MNTTSSESWFIPLDILGIICLTLAIILTIIFLIIIILDKTCHTVRMMLLANTCLTGLVCSSIHLSINIFTLHNDFKQISYQDSLCVLRGYLSYTSLALHMYSYLLSAIYQYVIIVYRTRLFWKSAQVHIFLIVLSWILASLVPLLYIFTSELIYNVDNQICHVPYRLSYSIFHSAYFIFLLPVNLIVIIYMKLVGYVQKLSRRSTLANTMHHARRDLNVVRRIVIIVNILFIAGIPTTLFALLSFFNHAPKYYIRLGFIFIYILLPIVMIVLFQFTDLLKTAVKKIIYGKQNIIIPTLVVKPIIFDENKAIEKRINESTQYQVAPKHRRITILE